LTFFQVSNQQVAHRPASNWVTVDELFDAELARAPQRPPGRDFGPEDAHLPEHLESCRPRTGVGFQVVFSIEQLHDVTHGDVCEPAAFGGNDDGATQRYVAFVHRGHRRVSLTGQAQARETIPVAVADLVKTKPVALPPRQQPSDRGTDDPGAEQGF
jgi:hypothetical protein